MGIREKINNNPAVTTGGAIFVIILAIFAIWYFNFSGGPPKPLKDSYFTIDDGDHYFEDVATKIPPFKDANGKEAVRCWVYQCGSGKPFVAYLDKYTDARKKEMEAASAGGTHVRGDLRDQTGHLYKKKGDKNWVDAGDDRAGMQAIIHVTCPEGGSGDPIPYPTKK